MWLGWRLYRPTTRTAARERNMTAECEPIVGNWYRRLDKAQVFHVVSLEDGDSIEIQHFDGALETLDYEDWDSLELEWIEPPEDWTGPVDDLDVDDLSYSDTCMEKEDWLASHDEHPPRGEDWEKEDDE